MTRERSPRYVSIYCLPGTINPKQGRTVKITHGYMAKVKSDEEVGFDAETL